MTKELIEKLRHIINSHKNLLMIYGNLYNYDISDNRLCDGFENQINLLLIARKIAKLHEDSLTLEDYANAYLHFHNIYNEKHINIFFYIATLDTLTSDIHRIYLFVERKVLENYHKLRMMGYILPIPGVEVSKVYSKYAYDYALGAMMCSIIEDDVLLTYFLLANDYLLNNPHSLYKDDLTEAKYNYSFANPRIEEILLNNRFNTNNQILINNLEFNSTINGEDLDITHEIKTSRLNYMIGFLLEEMLKEQHSSFELDSLEEFEFVNRSLLLQSILINYNKFEYEKIKNHIFSRILDLQEIALIDPKYARMIKTAISRTKFIYDHEKITRFNDGYSLNLI